MPVFSDLRSQCLFPPKPTLTEQNVTPQNGRVFIVTGGNSGIGYELCKILYGTGATIYMASRSEDRAKQAIKKILETKPVPDRRGQLKFLPLDLNNLESVKVAAATFAKQESKLDVLWNNAATGPWRIKPQAKTAQGLEAMMGMHCVATLLFTEILMPQLRASVTASATPGSIRVVWMASIAVEDAPHSGVEFEHLKDGTPDPVRNYAVSKAGSWMLSREMARRYGEEGILSITLNPGNVKAGSYDGAPWIMIPFLKLLLHDTKLGGYTSLFAGLSPEIHMEHNGSYIVPWGKVRPDRDCNRQDIIKAMQPENEGGLGYGKKLWEWCVEQWKPFT